MSFIYSINPKYESLRDFIVRIPSAFETEGKEIYHLRNVIKVMQAPDGLKVNVKRYHRPSGPNLFVYSWGIRRPKCERAFEYPNVLLENGISTPEPIACIEERGPLKLLGYSWFVSIQCDYGHTLYEMGDATPEVYKPMAQSLAVFTANMHSKGIMHKDYTPGNILWKKDAEGYHFSLVDINRMYFGKVTVKRGLKNMCRLWGPKEFIIHLARTYAACRNADPDHCVSYILAERKKFWLRFKKKHDIIFKLEL